MGRLGLPPNRGCHFSCILELPERNFKQDAEVSALPKTVEALMQNLPFLCQVVDGRETPPLAKPGTNHMAVICVLTAGEPQHNGFVVGYAAAVLNRIELSGEAERPAAASIE